MKKFFRFICILLVGVLLCALCACTYPSVEELLEECEMGQPEGLWLYKDLTRSRTDGSGVEYLLEELPIDGTVYAQDEIELKESHYFTGQNTAFFYLQTEEQDYFCFYNYKTKNIINTRLTGRKELHERPRFSYSATTVYIHYHSNGEAAYLYDYNGELLTQNIYDYRFDETLHGLTASASDTSTYNWWENGTDNSVEIPYLPSDNTQFFVAGNYTYLFTFTKKPHEITVISVNRASKEVSKLLNISGLNYSYNARLGPDDTFLILGAKETVIDDDISEYECFIYVLKDGAIYGSRTFDKREASYYYGDISVLKEKVYFSLHFTKEVTNKNATSLRSSTVCYRYDITKNKFHLVLQAPSEPRESYSPSKTINGYNFYITFKYYNDELHPYFNSGTCYFLNRKGPDGEFVMQYQLDDKHLFDDICDF